MTGLRQTYMHIEMRKQKPSRRNCEISRRVYRMLNRNTLLHTISYVKI